MNYPTAAYTSIDIPYPLLPPPEKKEHPLAPEARSDTAQFTGFTAESLIVYSSPEPPPPFVHLEERSTSASREHTETPPNPIINTAPSRRHLGLKRNDCPRPLSAVCKQPASAAGHRVRRVDPPARGAEERRGIWRKRVPNRGAQQDDKERPSHEDCLC